MDQLRKKMLDFTEMPPAKVWTAVESALEQEVPSLSKLASYSTPPPASLWKKIEAGLDENKKPARIILFSHKLTRIAVAAVILFGVFLGVRLFTPSPETNVITAVPQNQPPVTYPAPEPVTDDDNNDSVAEKPVRKKAPVVAKTYIRPAQPKRAEKKQITPQKTLRYTTMSNEEGETVRLSKKVAPVFNCAEARIKALSYYCRENIKLMQEKVGASLSPSADFAGLIDLLKTLEDDQ